MKTWQQCCDYFGVNVDRGLSTAEVKKNLDKYGPNGKSKKTRETLFTFYLTNFFHRKFMTKFVKLCLYLSYTVSISFYFDDIFL